MCSTLQHVGAQGLNGFGFGNIEFESMRLISFSHNPFSEFLVALQGPRRL